MTSECELEKEELLFSCVGEHNELQRLCPCRNYIKDQTALCQGCEQWCSNSLVGKNRYHKWVKNKLF